MQLSRRGLLGGLVALVAAPAIVRVESLMQVVPTEIIRPELPELVTRLDVLYGSMHVRPEWVVNAGPFTLDDYSERILAPMVERMQQQVADAVMYGTGAAKYDLHGMRSIGLADLLREARATPSDG